MSASSPLRPRPVMCRSAYPARGGRCAHGRRGGSSRPARPFLRFSFDLTAQLAKRGLDAPNLMDRSGSPEVKARLRAETEAVLAR